MAPFSDPRAGFCMVFRRASFIFSVPGTNIWNRDPIFDPGSRLPAPPGRCFAPSRISEKHGFVQEWIQNSRFRVTPRPKWIVWGLGGILARRFPSKPTRKLFPGNFLVLGGLGHVPWPVLIRLLWPFVAYCELLSDQRTSVIEWKKTRHSSVDNLVLE